MEIILFILLCLAYVLPAIIASSKAHPNSGAIWLFTLFLGWTGVAWIIALIWALNCLDLMSRFKFCVNLGLVGLFLVK